MTAFDITSCAACGVRFGTPPGYINHRRKDGRDFYCPNGHSLSFGETEADRLRRERDRLKQEQAHLQDVARHRAEERDAAKRQASAARGQVTRLKNRAAAGLCPCCNRSFQNLGRHMSTQHPTFTEAKP